MYVILDTQAIHNDFHLRNTHTNELLTEAPTRDLVVCVPEVVVREMVADFREDTVNKTVKRLQDVYQEANHLQLLVSPDIPAIDLAAEVRAYEKRFRALLKKRKVKVLLLPSITVEQLLERGISRRKPFKKDGQGMFDALIWESVVELWRQDPNQQYALITEDKDYADGEGAQIHPDLLADLGAVGIEARITMSAADRDLPRTLGSYPELHKSIQRFNEDWSNRSLNKTG